MQRSIFLSAFFILILSLQGCQILQEKIQQYYPEVVPGEPSVKLLSFDSAEITIPIKVQGRDGADSIMKSIRYSVSLGAEKAVEETSDMQSIVAPEGSHLVKSGKTQVFNIVKTIRLGKKIKPSSQPTAIDVHFSAAISGYLVSVVGLNLGRPQPFTVSTERSSSFSLPALPVLKLKKIEITTVDFLGANFNLVYEAQNQSAFAVKLQLLDREIYLNGQEIAETQGSAEVEIAALATNEFKEEARVHFLSAGRNLFGFLQNREARLLVKSRHILKTKNDQFSFSAEAASTITLPSVPKVRYVNTSFDGMDFESVDAVTNLEFENTSEIPLYFNGLYVVVSDGNSPIVRSDLERIELGSKQKKIIPVTQKILFSYFPIGAEKLFKSEKINIKLDAGITGFMGTDSDPIKIGGDAAFIPLKLPTLAYESFRWKRFGGSMTEPTAEFILTLSARNPNQLSMEVLKIDYSVSAFNARLAEGFRANINIPKVSSAKIEVPVVLKGREMLALVPQLKKIKDSDVVFHGSIQLKAAGEVLRVSYP